MVVPKKARLKMGRAFLCNLSLLERILRKVFSNADKKCRKEEKMADWYQILGVREDVTEEELKNTYRKLAKKYHPDSHPDDKECERRFQEISEAYNILSNEKKRRKYDEERKKAKKNNTAGTKEKRESASGGAGVDFANIHRSFEQFFGFNPNTHEVTREEKLNLKEKNPLDTTAIFEQFMGIKR